MKKDSSAQKRPPKKRIELAIIIGDVKYYNNDIYILGV